MSMALHGNLRDFGIGEVFQLIGQQRKTGFLEVNGEEARIRIAFEEGAVVWGERAGAYPGAGLGEMLVRTGSLTTKRLLQVEQAIETGEVGMSEFLLDAGDLRPDQLEDTLDLVTRDTVFELLRWTGGSFHFEALPLDHTRDPSRMMPAEQILMDGLRMVDEWTTLDSVAVDGESVFERSGHFDSYRTGAPDAAPEVLARAERLFLLIDGRQNTRRVVDLSRLGTFEGTRILSNLCRAGLIAPVAADTIAGRHRRRSLAELGLASPLGGILAVLPLVLLAAVVGALWVEGLAPIPGPTPAGLTAPQTAQPFELRRFRHAVEAYRFARGTWPRSLGDLSQLQGDLPGDMAAEGGHEYYYAHRGETFLVLAPED